MNKLTDRLDSTKEKISKLEGRAEEITQNAAQRGKELEQMKG